jgi:hypothetical protein
LSRTELRKSFTKAIPEFAIRNDRSEPLPISGFATTLPTARTTAAPQQEHRKTNARKHFPAGENPPAINKPFTRFSPLRNQPSINKFIIVSMCCSLAIVFEQYGKTCVYHGRKMALSLTAGACVRILSSRH